MDIIMNPVTISVVIMCVLCLLKLNVLIVLILSAIIAGVVGGMPIGGGDGIMNVFLAGMGQNTETATSYVLLGALAAGISRTGLANILSQKIAGLFKSKKYIFLVALAGIASLSQNLIPIHIAFIPILIPPLLHMMNEMKIDRRAAACSLCFGLKAPYVVLPVGFGFIYHGIIANNMTSNGVPMETYQVWPSMIWAGLAMIFGLFIAIFILYRKPREYADLPVKGEIEGAETTKFNKQHLGALLGAVSAFVIQLLTEQLALGAVVGLLIMLAFRCFEYKNFDDVINDGMAMMAWIAFVMLASAGYAEVLKATNGVGDLVTAASEALAGSKLIASTIMMLIGLAIVMGTGTSFGTVPVLAAIYVPLCLSLGYSPAGIVCLIGVASAIGDAGSPASDSTLGPTMGLNADGQHDHIWDTCVPTFIAYNIPLFFVGVVGSALL